MKENRVGACSCLVVAVLSLGLSIVFTVKELNWWSNFCFAIMGSALLSFVICLINYIILRKKLVEDLLKVREKNKEEKAHEKS